MSRNKNILAISTAAAIGIGAAAADNLLSRPTHKPSKPTPVKTEAKVYTVEGGDTEDGIFYKAGLDGNVLEFRDQLEKTIPDDPSHLGEYLQPGDKIFLPANSDIGKAVILKGHIDLPSYPKTNKS